jgi:YqaJ-like viral recombinase domain
MISEIKGIDVDQWHLKRWTKFTSSEKYKLLIGGSKGQVFGDGAMTYIKTKALEMSTVLQERPELDEVKSLLWGKVHELPAYEWYIRETKNYGMKYLGTETPVFIIDDEMPKESGGSPDGLLLGDTKVSAGLETKCPKNSMYHFDRLIWKDQWDIKENYISCYTQIQDLLRITEADVWHFLSFDDRQSNPKKKGKIIEVFPDKKFQDNLVLRTRMAVTEKYKIYERYINN